MLDLEDILDDITEQDVRYKREAYLFTLEALEFTTARLSKPRHVKGPELLNGIKDFAQDKFGPMTRTVLDHWGWKNTKDIGHIVFNLLDKGLLSKTADDSLDDFENVYDFDLVFGALNNN